MNIQLPIQSDENLANMVQIPYAPKLVPHTWPYPGMTPESSAQAGAASTKQYHEMLAAVIKVKRGAPLTTQQVLAAVPKDWRDLCGKYAHGNLSNSCANLHGIAVTYVTHEGRGHHFEYRAMDPAERLERPDV